MPGLVRGMVRTAAVVGTATATRNVVNRRQAEKNVRAYANAVEESYPTQAQPVYVQPTQAPSPTAAPMMEEDVITKLERLGALRAQGILTEEEFAIQKANLLGM